MPQLDRTEKGIGKEETPFRKVCEYSTAFFFFSFDVGGCHLNERGCLVEMQQRMYANKEPNAGDALLYSLVTESA